MNYSGRLENFEGDRMKVLTLFILYTVFLSTVLAQLEIYGLEDKTITSLALSSDRAYPGKFIVAGTDSNGLFIHHLTDSSNSWFQMGFDRRTVTAVFVQQRGWGPVEVSTIFAAVKPDSSIGDSTLIYSNDSPVQSFWSRADSGLNRNEIKRIVSFAGFDYSGHEPPMPIFCCAENPHIYSFQFDHWTKIWSGDELTVMQCLFSDDGIVWGGGWFYGFGTTLLFVKSSDYGQNWEEFSSDLGIIFNCFSLATTPGYPDTLYAGLNGTVVKSTDGGKTWDYTSLTNKPANFYGLVVHPAEPEHVHAGGYDESNQFVLFESMNGGESWVEIVPPINSKIAGITSMVGTILNDEFLLLIGTNGTGIYRILEKITFLKDQDVKYFERGFSLFQNYPNPFNPNTTIEFDVPKTSDVRLKIFNVLGDEVATLVSDRLPAGTYSYEWSRPVGTASGIYLYRLQAGEYVETRKMMLIQ